MPHAFFTGLRVFFEMAFSALALKLLRDVYLDRSNLSELWVKPRRYNSGRVFRVTGLVAALVGIITHVDFYGVFGIMDPLVVAIMVFSAIGLLWGAIYVTIYHELIATLPFFGVDNFEHPRRLQNTLLVNSVIHYSYVLTYFVNNRGFLLALSVVAVSYAVVMLVVVNAMYFSIRGHHNKMRKSQLRCYVGKPSHSWDKILRKWRTYVIILSSALVIAVAYIIYGLLVPRQDMLSQNSVNLIVDPNEAPHVSSIVIPGVFLMLTCGGALRSTNRPSASAQPLPDKRSNTKSSSAGKVIAMSPSAGEVVATSPSAGKPGMSSYNTHSGSGNESHISEESHLTTNEINSIDDDTATATAV